MANNYCESSSFLPLTPEEVGKAEKIISRIISKFEEDDNEGYFGADVKLQPDGVWFCHDESINPEHVAVLASALINELGIDEPFVFSWSYACSKPRIDEFGGGACVIRRGKEDAWFDAMTLAQSLVGEERLASKEESQVPDA